MPRHSQHRRRRMQVLLALCLICVVVLPLGSAQAAAVGTAASRSGERLGVSTPVMPLLAENTVLRAIMGNELVVALSQGGRHGVRTATATGLPAGLRLDPQTLRLVGTPRAVGVSQVQLRVTDLNGTMQTRRYLLQVGVVGRDYSGQYNLPIGTAPEVYQGRMGQILQVTAPGLLTNYAARGDGVARTVTLIAAPRFGQLALAPDGSFSYSPTVQLAGTLVRDAFHYRIDDGTQSVTATTTLLLHQERDQLQATELRAWGTNRQGQISRPTWLRDVVAIAAGSEDNLALRWDGTVVGWGYSSSGAFLVPAGLRDVVAINAGVAHSLALRRDGTVVAWGNNYFGQARVPAGLTDVVAIDGGYSASLALRRDGTVVAWGENGGAQARMPAGLRDVVAIDAGWVHGMALRRDGTVVSWGYGYGEEPTVPAGLTDVVAIAAGDAHSLALRRDGTVVAWGLDHAGQATVPAGLRDVVAIAAGEWHSLALRRDGTVVAWGDNEFGQATVPVGLKNVVTIAAGWSHNLALTTQ